MLPASYAFEAARASARASSAAAVRHATVAGPSRGLITRPARRGRSAPPIEASVAPAQAGEVPGPRGRIETPAAFITAIAKPRRGDFSGVLGALGGGEDGPTWDALFRASTGKLKAAGVPVKERRYFLWALEKYRQGHDPEEFAHDVKPKKKIRGWGPRVQNGKRVRGRRRPNEK